MPDPPPAEFQALLERRRRWGADTRDEVWEGVLHINPAPHGRHAQLQAQVLELLGRLGRARALTPFGEFNLGDPDDYRVADAGLLTPGPAVLYNPTAALVVEIASPGDETPEKLSFYASHGVQELVIIDAEERRIDWLELRQSEYRPVDRSGLLDLNVTDIELSWPE